MAAVVALLAVLVMVLGAAVVQVLRSQQRLTAELADVHRRLDRATPAPQPTAAQPTAAQPTAPKPATAPPPAVAGVPAGTGGGRLLAFLSPECTTCATFWDAFAAGVSLPPDTTLAVVTHDLAAPPDAAFAARIDGVVAAGTTVTHHTGTWTAYDVPLSPYFVLVDASGRVVAEGAADTWERVRSILG